MAKNHTLLLYIITVLLIVTIALSGILIFVLTKNTVKTETIDAKDQMRWTPPEGFIKVDSVKVEGTNVVVVKDCIAINAQTTPERALGIFNALNNKTGERPDIYESTASILQTFDIKLEAVLVHRFEKETFFADSYFRVKDQILQLDMKPSDAMAIAFRTGSPIYYNLSLFNATGQKIC